MQFRPNHVWGGGAVNKEIIEAETGNIRSINANNNLTGEIIHQVFVAMKLRNLPRENLSLRLYQESEAANRHEQLMERREREKRRDEEKRIGRGVGGLLTFAEVGRIDPPGLDVEVR